MIGVADDELNEEQLKKFKDASSEALELIADNLHSDAEIDAWVKRVVEDVYLMGEQLKANLRKKGLNQ